MPSEQRYREEPYNPPKGKWHQATNALTDKWGRRVTQSLGASHAWVLTVVERLVIGYQRKARRVSISEIAQCSGLGRERVYEILADLEETGVIAIHDRARGRRPLIAVRLDWNPTQEALAAGMQFQKARSERKHAESGDKEVSTPVDTPVDTPAEEKLSTPDNNQVSTPVGNFKEQEMSTPVGNQMSTSVGNNIERDTKEAFTEADGSCADRGLACGQASLFDRKERNPTPPHPSSSSSPGKKGRPTDDDYAEGAKRRAELVALGENAPREEKGSEEELEGWRHLEAKAKTVPLGECDWLAADFAERFAPRLRLENKPEKLQQVHEWVVRQNRDAFKPVWLVALRCAAEQEKGTVRNAWAHFLSALANEWNDNIRHLPPPYTEEVLCGRVEVEETAHALEVLQDLPGWPPNSEKEVSALVLKCLWDEDYLFSTILESYTEYVRRMGGVQNAKIEAEPVGALEHLKWFLVRHPNRPEGTRFTLDGRLEQREVASNTV